MAPETVVQNTSHRPVYQENIHTRSPVYQSTSPVHSIVCDGDSRSPSSQDARLHHSPVCEDSLLSSAWQGPQEGQSSVLRRSSIITPTLTIRACRMWCIRKSARKHGPRRTPPTSAPAPSARPFVSVVGPHFKRSHHGHERAGEWC